eukprot:9016594-Prorocentrum_lima.AAC.1
MTSSLVGSEMCIRDRAYSPDPSCKSTVGVWVPFLQVPRKDDSVYGFVPVSYTHLTLPTICSV